LGGIRNYFVRVSKELVSSIVDKIIPIIDQDGLILLQQKQQKVTQSLVAMEVNVERNRMRKKLR